MTDHLDRLRRALQDRYTVEHEIGAGGMATVYRAHDTRHNRKVALKVFRPELAAIVGAERFLKEIEVTAGLQHPHILPLYDSGQADGLLYYVMPWVEGESLRDRLDRERQLPVDEAVRLADEVADALGYAHARNVVHRDIKPENVLLRDGRALVADFGIALAVHGTGSGRLTETGLSLGTPSYMSPEQAAGDRDIDHRTDLYSTGCLLYEMLAGHPPYAGASPQAVLARVLIEDPPPIRHERTATPPNVAATIHKAMARLPADRFADAGAFRSALADPAFGIARAAGSVRRPAVWAVALASLVAGLLVGYASRPDSQAPAVRRIAARLQFDLPVGVSLPLDSDYPLLTVSPDGSRVIFVGEADGHRSLYSRLLTDSIARIVPGTEGAFAPFFSPDGSRVAFMAGGMIYTVPPAGGAPIAIFSASMEGVSRGVAWISDSMLVAVGSPNSGLQRGFIIEGEAPPITDWDTLTGPELPASWPATMGDRNEVLFARSPSDGGSSMDGVRYSLETGQSRVVLNRVVFPRYASTGHLLFARDGVLHAVLYDPQTGTAGGEEHEVVRGVAGGGFGVSQYAEGGGVLAWVEGETSATDFELVWIDPADTVASVVRNGDRFSDPRVSRDGRRIALTITEGPNLDVWVLDTERGALQPFTRHPGEDFDPVWSPDGRSLALASEVGEASGELGPAVALIRELGGPTEQLIFSPGSGRWEFPTDWTPDGNSIVVVTRRAGESSNIALYPVDGGGGLQPLVDSQANETGARVSPNGAWLAYVSDRSGTDEIWIQPFGRPGNATQVSTQGGTEPVWARDSSELYYRSGLDMMAVRMGSGPDGEPGSPVLLFTGRYEPNQFGGGAANFDVSQDGRFLMVRRRSTFRPTSIQVALDWPTVLLPPPERN